MFTTCTHVSVLFDITTCDILTMYLIRNNKKIDWICNVKRKNGARVDTSLHLKNVRII